MVTAFIYGYIEQVVYVKQPEGFVDPDRPAEVCKATIIHIWSEAVLPPEHAKIDKLLSSSISFIICSSDPC